MTKEDILNDLRAQQTATMQAAFKHAQNQLAQQNMASQGLGNVSGGAIGPWQGGFGQPVNTPFAQNDPLEEELERKKSKINIRDLDISVAADTIEKVLKTPIVPFLWGPPGIGKSTLVKSIANKNKWKLIDLRLSLLNPVDLRGLPVIDKDNKQADWYPPTFLPKFDTKEMGILFLDEINLAPLSVQAAAYQLILDKRVGI